MDIEYLEEIYLKAKEAYYNGEEELMTDDEFDKLEEELKELGSYVVTMVGTADRNFKHQHLSPMTSLSKAQATLEGILPIEQTKNWFSTFPKKTKFEGTPKYDGNAVNLIYRKGKLEKAITRGDKFKGKDVTSKLMRKVPLFIDVDKDVEVRGEVVIKVSIFNEKYAANAKNPRNFVAGILNKDDNTQDILNEIDFMAIEVRIHDGDFSYPEDTQAFLLKHGFNKEFNHFKIFEAEEFETVYYEMKNYRENVSPFQLDGFVIKAQEDIRLSMGDNGHHPKWAIAIKFPPKQSTTKVASIRWNVGTSGEIVPIIGLVPVELDGTTVRNAAGFNAGNIIKNGLFPGAIVAIAKAGDIIPQIVKIIVPEFNGSVPELCTCGQKAHLDGIHLMCSSDECGTRALKKFVVGIGTYRMDKFGGVTRRLIFESGFDQIWKIFDRDLFNEQTLIDSGNFKAGKTLTNLLTELDKLKKVSLPQVILSLGFNGIGSTAAKELAKYIRGQEYSFSGLEKVCVEGFEEGSEKRNKIDHLVSVLIARGVEVEDEFSSKDGIGYEMTGHPFKTETIKVKSDFEKVMLKHGYVFTGLKTGKILFTDDMNSSSGKMKAARKNKIEIKTYEDILRELGEI